MTRVGTMHKTGAYGDAAEIYSSRIFRMARNPNGNLRPDLLVDQSVHPYPNPFAIEVKGGKRGILLKGQLCYGLNNLECWRTLLGRRKGNRLARNGQTRLFVNEGERVFYSIVKRTDGIAPEDLVGDFSTVRLQWGDMFLLPADIVFNYFASVLSTKNNTRIGRTVRGLKRFISKSIKEKSSFSDDRDPDNWISLPFSSCRAIFEGEVGGIRNDTQRKTLSTFFRYARNNSDYGEYGRAQLPLPGSNHLYIVYPQKDAETIRSIEDVVRKSVPSLRTVALERKEVKEKFERERIRLTLRSDYTHYYNGGIDSERREELVQAYEGKYGLDNEGIDLLERLVSWETKRQYDARKQAELSEIPF